MRVVLDDDLELGEMRKGNESFGEDGAENGRARTTEVVVEV
jgi:hypothetical protein